MKWIGVGGRLSHSRMTCQAGSGSGDELINVPATTRSIMAILSSDSTVFHCPSSLDLSNLTKASQSYQTEVASK